MSASAFPALARWNGGDAGMYFWVAAGLNLLGAVLWWGMPYAGGVFSGRARSA